MENTNNIRWLFLAFGSLTLLLGGMIYSWSILKSPLAGEFGWNPTQLALNFTITICCFGIGGLISGLLAKKLSPRVRLIGSAVLVFTGFFISSKVGADSLGLLYISYGLLGGIGIGVLYNTTIATIGEWFPDRKGLASGIMLMCFGFSTLIFGSLAGSFIANPEFGWRKTYILLGVVMAIVVFIFGLIVHRPSVPVAAKAKAVAASSTKDFTAMEMLKTSTFWKLFIALAMLASIGNVTLSFAKDFAMFTGSAETAAITIVGIMSVCNGLGRLFSGALYDNLSLRKTQLAITLIMLIAPIVGILAITSGGEIVGIMALLLCGFSYGLCPTTSAIYPKLFFGEKNYALNFSITNLTLIPTSFVATLAGAILTSTGSYLPVFFLLLAFAVIGSILLLLIKR
ncbi:MAG: MFS transporter [Eubacteriales bacterium]|nr:MFS transporter [Eubacteriales bacterium]